MTSLDQEAKGTDKRPYLVGLTGGIATGKNLVGSFFQEAGIAVLDADEIAHQILAEPSVGEKIFKEWPEVRGEDGSVNRKKLAGVVFSSPLEREKLNAFTHPGIIEGIHREVGRSGGDIVVIMAPLLIEGGLSSSVDEVWTVAISVELQVKRLMKRDGISREESLKKISSQLPGEIKTRAADVVIDNSGTPDETRKEVERRISELLERVHGLRRQ